MDEHEAEGMLDELEALTSPVVQGYLARHGDAVDPMQVIRRVNAVSWGTVRFAALLVFVGGQVVRDGNQTGNAETKGRSGFEEQLLRISDKLLGDVTFGWLPLSKHAYDAYGCVLQTVFAEELKAGRFGGLGYTPVINLVGAICNGPSLGLVVCIRKPTEEELRGGEAAERVPPMAAKAWPVPGEN